MANACDDHDISNGIVEPKLVLGSNTKYVLKKCICSHTI